VLEWNEPAPTAGSSSPARSALIRYARQDLEVERINWRCTTVNPRSRALAERLGFKYEGKMRSAYDLDVLSLVGSELTRPA